MKLTKLYSDQVVNISLQSYKIDWSRKVSAPQFKTKQFLESFWKWDVVYEEVMIPGSKKRIDLWNESKKLIIEVSPKKVHTEYNEFFHKSRSGFLKKLQTDNDKKAWGIKNGYDYVELDDKDIKNLSKQLFLEKFNITL